jgi:RHS repeat-associated protein
MPVTTYATVAGRVLMENRAGTVREYLHDPLGSTIALLDSSNTKTHTASYWPYGEVQSGNVSSVTAFGFCGAWGYYTENHFMYVRARYYLQDVGRWLTVDPLWPDGSGYGYADCSPTVLSDPSGLKPTWPKPNDCSLMGTSPRAICIAMLCSMNTAMDFHSGLKDLAQEGVIDNAKALLDQYVKNGCKPPSLSPEDCCKEASGRGLGGPLPDPVATIIGQLCGRAGAGTTPCSLLMRTFRGCERCCRLRYRNGSVSSNIKQGVCLNLCHSRWVFDIP